MPVSKLLDAGPETGFPVTPLFDEWTSNRSIPFLGTNSGAAQLPFQGWHRFKEAFPPELILRAVKASPVPVSACFDPFGGSGTTALASQFLGVGSTTIEVNPFLADVIRAKLAHCDADELTTSFAWIRRRSRRHRRDPAEFFAQTPRTFIEPGVDGRWLFDSDVAAELAATLSAIDELPRPDQRRFFRAVLGGLLVDVSNVVISGKGRRYRRNWQARDRIPGAANALFSERVGLAISDLHRFSGRPRVRTEVKQGDARRITPSRPHQLVVFSPPYPNSFDYTDVYNVELWMLGYLTTAAENRELRHATLSSHVQMQRRYADPPSGSPALDQALASLGRIQEQLWSPWIPAMIGAYFADLVQVLRRTRATLDDRGLCWIVVGDSRYGGVHVPTAEIVADLAPLLGWRIASFDAFRAMRSSAQQGGRNELSETLIVMGNDALAAVSPGRARRQRRSVRPASTH
jgi:hypothetical protein